MRRSSAPGRRAIPLLIASLALAGASCDVGTGRGFAHGRACRIGERMVAAVAVGDTVAADDEVERLDDLDGSDERFDLDEIADVVDTNDDGAIDDLRELFDDGECDIDEPETPPAPDSTPSTVDVPPPTGTPSTSTATSDDTTPPFTLPIPTGTSTTTTSPSTPTTDEPPPTTPVRANEVDVDATDSDLAPGECGAPVEAVARHEATGMLIPAGPAAVTFASITRGLTYGASYESMTSVVDTVLEPDQTVSRFRIAVARIGAYRFRPTESPGADNVGFRAEPEDESPTWTVDVKPYEADEQLSQITVTRSRSGDDAPRSMPAAIMLQLERQLGVFSELGWTPESVGETCSDLGAGDASRSTSVTTTVLRAEPEDLAQIVLPHVDGGRIEPMTGGVQVVSEREMWLLSNVGDSDVSVFTSVSD